MKKTEKIAGMAKEVPGLSHLFLLVDLSTYGKWDNEFSQFKEEYDRIREDGKRSLTQLVNPEVIKEQYGKIPKQSVTLLQYIIEKVYEKSGSEAGVYDVARIFQYVVEESRSEEELRFVDKFGVLSKAQATPSNQTVGEIIKRKIESLKVRSTQSLFSKFHSVIEAP